MYPLKRKPTKLISKVVIIMIWICGFLFALPMAYAFTFDNVPESYPIPGKQQFNIISKFVCCGCYMKKNVAFTITPTPWLTPGTLLLVLGKSRVNQKSH